MVFRLCRVCSHDVRFRFGVERGCSLEDLEEMKMKEEEELPLGEIAASGCMRGCASLDAATPDSTATSTY